MYLLNLLTGLTNRNTSNTIIILTLMCTITAHHMIGRSYARHCVEQNLLSVSHMSPIPGQGGGVV